MKWVREEEKVHEAHSSQLGQPVGASELCVACVKFMGNGQLFLGAIQVFV